MLELRYKIIYGRILCLLVLLSIYLAESTLVEESAPELPFVTALLSEPLLLATNVGDRYSCQPKRRYRDGTQINEQQVQFHLRGTSLGGFLVLEPWITPSLFYQFLGLSERYPAEEAIQRTAFDSLTFCKALGGVEANRQLRIHWQNWVTESQIANLAAIGVETVRIPVADWMFDEYPPFNNGCWEGAVAELDRALELCYRYNLTVLLDLHALRGSQNGLDNSGDTSHYRWILEEKQDSSNDSFPSSASDTSLASTLRYSHWEIRGGDWAGNYDEMHHNYSSINTSHILHSLNVLNIIVERYKDHPAIIGLQPVNEPWQYIPFEVLQEFYWRSFQIIRIKAPNWLVVFHDSFRLTEDYWGRKSQSRFLEGCDHYAVDIHIYHAWANDNPIEYFVKNACFDHNHLKEMEELGVPVIVGEWSLATDNCAMWLNGLNDNVPTFPKVKCDRIQCPDPYFPVGLIENAPPDSSKGIQGPIGTGGPSFVEHGTCPVDRSYPDEINNVQQFSYAQLYSYDLFTHGFFFWNFRAELESRWDYQKAVKNDWLPINWNSAETRAKIEAACYLSPSPPPSSPTLKWIIRIGGIIFLLGSFTLLLTIFIPPILRHFRITRSGYVMIPSSHDGDVEFR